MLVGVRAWWWSSSAVVPLGTIAANDDSSGCVGWREATNDGHSRLTSSVVVGRPATTRRWRRRPPPPPPSAKAGKEGRGGDRWGSLSAVREHSWTLPTEWRRQSRQNAVILERMPRGHIETPLGGENPPVVSNKKTTSKMKVAPSATAEPRQEYIAQLEREAAGADSRAKSPPLPNRISLHISLFRPAPGPSSLPRPQSTLRSRTCAWISTSPTPCTSRRNTRCGE